MSCLYLYLLQLCARKLRCQPQPLNTLYSRDILSLPTSEKAVVVQWSAHPTWYPKLLSALPKNLKLSLEVLEAVDSNPTHGALLFFLVAVCQSRDRYQTVPHL
jgi:hypothetical protein